MITDSDRAVDGPLRSRRFTPFVVAAGVLVIATAALRLEGRLWWCAAGDSGLWTTEAWGAHTSQHFLDPYSLTHVSHGLVLWGVLWLVAGRAPATWRFVAGISLEALWEVFENSPMVIERYRAATAALGYTGDTIVNSLGDIAACGVGLFLAYRLGWRWSVALFLALEVLLLVWIRDSLLLNVVMLLYPVDVIRRWQLIH